MLQTSYIFQKQDAKDSSIHKRLSWNYPPPPPPAARDLEGRNNNNKPAAKTVSCESVHSSSGVSSTSSLHRSVGSEVEGLEDIDDDNELEGKLAAKFRNLIPIIIVIIAIWNFVGESEKMVHNISMLTGAVVTG